MTAAIADLSLDGITLKRQDLEWDLEASGSDRELTLFIGSLSGEQWSAAELLGTIHSNPGFLTMKRGKSSRESTLLFLKVKKWLMELIEGEIYANHLGPLLSPDDTYEDASVVIGQYVQQSVKALFASQ